MRDKFGTFRGKCEGSCACIEFKANEDGSSVRCAQCNHAPTKHEAFGVLGACTGCGECEKFECSYGEFAFCEYCECSIERHASAPPKPVIPVATSADRIAAAKETTETNTGSQRVNTQTHTESYMRPSTGVPELYKQQQQQQQQQRPQPQQHVAGETMLQHNPLQTGLQLQQMGPTRQSEPMGATPFNCPIPPQGSYPMGQNIPINVMGQLPGPTGQSEPMGATPFNCPIPPQGSYPMGQNIPINVMGQLPMEQMGGNMAFPMGSLDPGFNMNMAMANQFIQPQQMMPNPMKCAIQECNQPPFMDPFSGQLQACCSITHAMEHERRKSLGNNVTKGITHCLLPSCSRHVWPFMNYCGKTHAEAGKQLGLIPPDPNAGTSAQRDVSEGVCALPGCKKPRFLDEGKEHPYCSRSHSAQGVSQAISPESVNKPEDRCAIPGCWKAKFVEAGVTHPFCSKSHRKKAEAMGSKLAVDPNAQCDLPSCNMPKLIEKDGTQQDYCSKSHADKDTGRRDAAILTPRKEVEKWLGTFPNLKITDVKENPHAQPGGALFNAYKEKYKSLAKGNRKTAMAFHGTVDANIDSICQNGYNPALRRGQAHGPGEYFATSPDVSFSFCRGGKRMLVNELLLGTPNQHHTQSGGIIVMKDPAHDLPRFVITFQ